MTVKKCTKKRDARAELLFCQSKPIAFLPFSLTTPSSLLKGDVIRDDLQRRFLAQHSVAMLEQCGNHSKQCVWQRCVALKVVVASSLV